MMESLMEVQLIEANIEDADALIAIQKQAFKRLYELYGDEQNPYLREKDEMLRWLDNPNRFTWKIHVNDILCGGLSVVAKADNEFYLARVFVLPKMQGKGIAATAIKLCEAQFPHAKKWTLDFPIDQMANKKCYEKCGYLDTGVVEVKNEKLTLAFYEK